MATPPESRFDIGSSLHAPATMETVFGRRFKTFEEAREAIDCTTEELGFQLVIQTKRPNTAQPTRMVMHCCQGCEFRKQPSNVHESRRRLNSTTQMMDCGYRLRIKGVRDCYYEIQPPTEYSSSHNHELDGKAFPRIRRQILEKRKDDAIRLHKQGKKPAEILATL